MWAVIGRTAQNPQMTVHMCNIQRTVWLPLFYVLKVCTAFGKIWIFNTIAFYKLILLHVILVDEHHKSTIQLLDRN